MIPNQWTSSIALVFQIAALVVTLSIQCNLAFGNLQQHPTPINSSSCNAETEFHCKLDGRCIALEQHCDFQEQCLDGEDELGCPPERCNFEHDHCYWLDALSSNHTHDFWRRFPIASSGFKRAGQITSASNKPANTFQLTTTSKLAARQSLSALLDELSLGLPERAKFLFVPLRWTRPTASNHLWTRRAEIRTPTIGRTSGACQLRFEYALLSTVGLHAGLPNASITLQLVASPNGPQSGLHGGKNNSIGLARQVVWSSHRVVRGQAPEWSRVEPLEFAKSVGQQHWIVGVAELGHLRNFELSFEAESSIGPEAIDDDDDDDGGPEHSKTKFNQAELGGKPSSGGGAILSPPAGPPNSLHWEQLWRVRNQPINKESALVAGGSGQDGGQDDAKLQVKLGQATEVPAKTRSSAAAVDNFEGALAAIRWLEFRNCHDWPQVGRERAATGAEDKLNNDEDVTNPNPNDELLAVIPHEDCPKDEFTCSSGWCLQNKLLCNFHDDCYSLNGQPSYIWPWPKFLPATSDDESDDLCRILLGRENFEPTNDKNVNHSILDNRRESNQMQLYSTSKPDKFWHLTGTWPISRVTIRRSLASNETKPVAHLPSRDHTIRSAEGSFLSLEVPPAGTNRANTDSYWVSITSQWMQRLDEEEFGQCRLKFFHNFISTLAGQHAGNFTPDTPKLIIALEHITLSNDSQRAPQHGQQWPFGRQQPKFEKTVDTILHSGLEIDTSQLTTYNRSHSSIELAGLDFWRESNFELVNLKAGDFFQLRLVLLIQIQNSNTSRRSSQRAEPFSSINIDDMATHFGCGLVEDSHQLLHLNKMALPYWQMDVPKLTDYVKPHRPNRTESRRRQLPPLKNKWNHFKTPTETSVLDEANYPYGVEPTARASSLLGEEGNSNKLRRHFEQVPPQLLVAYVLFAFCLILGLIALIVFVMVPHVERAMMHHQNQIQLSLSSEISDVPATISQPSTSDFFFISPSGSTRAGSLFGGAFDRLDDETHFSAERNSDVDLDQSQ